MANRDIRVRFKGDTRDLDQAFGRVRRGADRTDKSVQGVSKSFGALKGAIVASGVLVVGTQVARFTKAMFDLGSAVEETGSKFRTTFGQSSAAVDEFIASFGRLAGVTQSEGQALLATTGAIAQGFGFAQGASADFAQQIFRTAADMASFNNLPTDDVLQRITAALAGERESMKRLGVVIMETDVQARAFAMTGKSVAKELTQQEKATATLALITERAAVAMGDLERTSSSSANVAKKAAGDFRQLKEDIAVVVKDALVPLLLKISELGDALNQNRDAVRRWATFFVAASVGAINIVIQSFDRYLALLRIARGLSGAGTGLATGNVGAIGAGFQQAGQGASDFASSIGKTVAEFNKMLAALDESERAISGFVGPTRAAATAAGDMAAGVRNLGGAAAEAVGPVAALDGILVKINDHFAENATVSAHVATAWEKMWAASASGAKKTDEEFSRLVSTIAGGVRGLIDFGGALSFIGPKTQALLGSLTNLGQNIAEIIVGGLTTGGMIGAIGGGLAALGSVLGSVFKGGPSFSDRVTKAMDNLAVTAGLLRLDFEKLAKIARELADAQTLGPLKALGAAGVGLDRFAVIKEAFGSDPVAGLKAQLDAAGLTFLDLKNAADAMNVDVSELLKVLFTGRGDLAEASAQLETFFGLIDLLPDPIDAAAMSMARLSQEAGIFDQSLQEQAEALRKFFLATVNLPGALEQELGGLNLGTGEGIRRAEEIIEGLGRSFFAGEFGPGEFGAFSRDEFFKALSDFEGFLDRLAGDAGAGREGFTVSRSITDVQANVLNAGMTTLVTIADQELDVARASFAQLVAMTVLLGGAPVPAASVLPGSLPSTTHTTFNFDVNVNGEEAARLLDIKLRNREDQSRRELGHTRSINALELTRGP